MTKPYSMDLRDRAVARVLAGESVRAVALALSIGAATVVRWSQRYRATGSAAPIKVAGQKRNILSGSHRDWLLDRTSMNFTLRGLVAELATRGVRVDYVQVWRFALAEGLSFKKAYCTPNSSAQRSQEGARNGRNIRDDLIQRISSSLAKLGRRPTCLRCGAGQPVNAVAPGRLDDDFNAPLFHAMPPARDYIIQNTAVSRIGMPKDVSGVIAFLCSPEASFVSGATVNIYGGYHL